MASATISTKHLWSIFWGVVVGNAAACLVFGDKPSVWFERTFFEAMVLVCVRIVIWEESRHTAGVRSSDVPRG